MKLILVVKIVLIMLINTFAIGINFTSSNGGGGVVLAINLKDIFELNDNENPSSLTFGFIGDDLLEPNDFCDVCH